VQACGLGNYYRLRESAGQSFAPAAGRKSKFEAFDTETFVELYVETNGNHRTVDLALEGVSCGACVWLIEKLPEIIDGVIEARLGLRQSIVRISWDSRAVSLSKIARTLDQLGYRSSPARGKSEQGRYRAEFRRRLIDLGVAGALAGNLMLLGAAMYAGWFGGMELQYQQAFRICSLLLGVTALAWPGRVFFRAAMAAIRSRSMNLDVPICMALLAGGIAGCVNVVLNRGEIYFDSLAALIFLLLVGRFIQFQQQRRCESAVHLLFSMMPASCRVVSGDDEVSEVPVEALQPGMIAEVYAGELFPADGVVVSGGSSANLALLTGESGLVPIGGGDRVFGGTQNGPGTVRIEATRCGADSRMGSLMQLLERGLTEKPPIVRFTDRVGSWFVLLVSLTAVLTFFLWAGNGLSIAVDHAVALIIVTCPCVLGLAAPMTMAVAIGRLARRNILVKSASTIERLAAGGQLILDKTGTLTTGAPQIIAWTGPEALRGVAAAVEAQSTHPIGRAIHRAYQAIEPPATWRQAMTNRTERGDGGVAVDCGGRRLRIGSPGFVVGDAAEISADLRHFQAQHERAGSTVVLVGVDGRALAGLAFGDAVRPDAADAIAQLRAMGFSPSIYSGDVQAAVTKVAEATGIDPKHATGAMSPEDKLAAVGQGMKQTIMVGDGVNDAAALAAAGVGIAVQGGAEVSLAAADVYLARPGLSGIIELVQTARRAMRVVRLNLGISLVYNIIAGSLAVAGLMTPLAAAIIMPMSSATVLAVAVLVMSRDTSPAVRS